MSTNGEWGLHCLGTQNQQDHMKDTVTSCTSYEHSPLQLHLFCVYLIFFKHWCWHLRIRFEAFHCHICVYLMFVDLFLYCHQALKHLWLNKSFIWSYNFLSELIYIEEFTFDKFSSLFSDAFKTFNLIFVIKVSHNFVAVNCFRRKLSCTIPWSVPDAFFNCFNF